MHLHVGGDGKVADNTADEDEVADIDAMEDGQLSRAIDEVRNTEGAKAEVHRVLPADRAGFCRAYAVSVFSHERIAADYGPGKYRVRFKGPGDKYIPGGTTFSIAEGLQPANTQTASSVADVLALFRAEREREKEAAEKKKGEWLEWAKLLAPLLAPKVLDMLGGSKGPSIRDLVATMKDMKDLQAPPADLTAQFSQVMGILQGAKDLVGGDGDSGKVGSTWVDLLRDFIQSPAAGALASAIPGLAAAPPSAPLSPSPAFRAGPAIAAPQGPVASSGSAPATAPGSANCSPQDHPDMLQQLQWLRGTLAQLLVQAAKNANPRLYAEVVLDNLPPYIEPQALFDRLSAEGWFKELQQVEPSVATHAEWFDKFRAYAVKLLRRRLRAAAEAAAPPPPPGVNEPMVEGEGGDFE